MTLSKAVGGIKRAQLESPGGGGSNGRMKSEGKKLPSVLQLGPFWKKKCLYIGYIYNKLTDGLTKR